MSIVCGFFFFFQAEDGIRDYKVTGVQTCALPISPVWVRCRCRQRCPGRRDSAPGRAAMSTGSGEPRPARTYPVTSSRFPPRPGRRAPETRVVSAAGPRRSWPPAGARSLLSCRSPASRRAGGVAGRRRTMMRMARVATVNRMMGVAVAIMMLLAACSSMTGKTLGENIDDAGITAKVKAKLAGEKISTVTRIDVDTNQGVVALNGTVSSEEMRVRAAQLARDVKGVRDVVNNLRVQAS